MLAEESLDPTARLEKGLGLLVVTPATHQHEDRDTVFHDRRSLEHVVAEPGIQSQEHPTASAHFG